MSESTDTFGGRDAANFLDCLDCCSVIIQYAICINVLNFFFFLQTILDCCTKSVKGSICSVALGGGMRFVSNSTSTFIV